MIDKKELLKNSGYLPTLLFGNIYLRRWKLFVLEHTILLILWLINKKIIKYNAVLVLDHEYEILEKKIKTTDILAALTIIIFNTGGILAVRNTKLTFIE